MKRYLFPGFVAVVVAVGWVFAMPPAPMVQPIAFNHATHASAGCVLCHQGAATGVRAGIPQAETCSRCHATAPGRAISAAAWTDIAAGKRIAWKRLTRLPDHVAFSHRRHTSAGQLACASCHGDMAQRTAPPSRAPVRLVMDTCLSCHKREGASEDCAGCHR
jgi:hypothetical protein